MASTIWKGRLAFGLVSIPVRLQRAARRERIRFHHVYRPATAVEPDPEPEIPAEPEPEPPRSSRVRAFPAAQAAARMRETEPELEDEAPSPVERVRHAPPEAGEVFKGYEYEKDRYVVLDRAEVAALRPRTSGEFEIVQFVRLPEVDPVYFDVSYYALPDAGADKQYALLYEALKKTGYAGLGTFAMHGREHAAAIRPGAHGLLLHTLFYANEIRAADEHRVEPGLVNPKELELAGMFVNALAAPFDPERFKDTFEEKVRALIEQRAKAGLAPGPSAVEPAKASAPVVDIMEALRKSLEMAKKPAAREARPRESAPRKRARTR